MKQSKINIIIILLAVVAALSLVSPEKILADYRVSGSSATLTRQTKREDNRAEVLRAYLKKYNSPLVTAADTFIAEADKNRLDWKFVASIAGVESWFGQKIPYNSYNGWGWGVYGNNVHYFSSWNEAIVTISSEIRRKYMDTWGAKDVYGIGRSYAADPRWAQKVIHFMAQIDAFEQEYSQDALSISL